MSSIFYIKSTEIIPKASLVHRQQYSEPFALGLVPLDQMVLEFNG